VGGVLHFRNFQKPITENKEKIIKFQRVKKYFFLAILAFSGFIFYPFVYKEYFLL